MDTIFYIIFSLVLLGLCGIVAYTAYKNIPKNVISFKESVDLTELPIVTFRCGSKKLHFILDSGATTCILDGSVLESIKNEYCFKTDKVDEVYGIEGNVESTDVYRLIISYANLDFEEDFLIGNLKDAFDNVKKECGLQLHGMIGNNFFIKHKYILDFDKMIFYNKK